MDYLTQFYGIKGRGYCKVCFIEQETEGYIFCSIECSELWCLVIEGSYKGKLMANYAPDKELYVKWFQEKTLSLDKMSLEEIEKRVEEVGAIYFYARAEWSMLAQQWEKISGRKGLAPFVKERGNLISEPDFKIDRDGEPRPKKDKVKKPKENLLAKFFPGVEELNEQMKNKKKSNGSESETKTEKPKPTTAKDDLAAALDIFSNPKPAKKEPTEEEKKKQAADLEQMLKDLAELEGN